jgi:cytoskeleton protein RodZ
LVPGACHRDAFLNQAAEAPGSGRLRDWYRSILDYQFETDSLPIFYDLLSQQGKIRFAVQRKRETGLPSFGEKLKLEREKRKITLEQISVSTKIGTRMLQALEEDKFNQLPGGIFNKGFVRAYSRAVGLDEDQTVADYLQASGDAPPVSIEAGTRADGRLDSAREVAARANAENIGRLQASSDAPPRQFPLGLFAAALLIIALALYFWSRHRREHAGPSVRPTLAGATPSPAMRSSSEGPGGMSAKATGRVSASSGSVGEKTPQNIVSAASSAPVAGEFTVAIQAREESWVSITADRKTISSELLDTGSERLVHAKKEVIVKIGNAGGVDLKFNGQKLATVGEFGEVKTITFGPSGIVPTASAPPSTP